MRLGSGPARPLGLALVVTLLASGGFAFTAPPPRQVSVTSFTRTFGGRVMPQGHAIDAAGNSYAYYFDEAGYAHLLKRDPDGEVIFNLTVSISGATSLGKMTTDSAGNVIVFGNYYPGGAEYSDAYLAKFDSTGKALWQMTVTGTGTYEYPTGTVTTDAAGNIFCSGYIYDPSGRGIGDNYDGWTASIGPNGLERWLYRTTINGNDQGAGVYGDGAGGAIFVDTFYQTSPYPTVVRRIDSTGALQWSRTIYSTRSANTQRGAVVVSGSDVLVAYNDGGSALGLARLDLATGAVLNQRTNASIQVDSQGPLNAAPVSSGGFVVAYLGYDYASGHWEPAAYRLGATLFDVAGYPAFGNPGQSGGTVGNFGFVQAARQVSGSVYLASSYDEECGIGRPGVSLFTGGGGRLFDRIMDPAPADYEVGPGVAQDTNGDAVLGGNQVGGGVSYRESDLLRVGAGGAIKQANFIELDAAPCGFTLEDLKQVGGYTYAIGTGTTNGQDITVLKFDSTGALVDSLVDVLQNYSVYPYWYLVDYPKTLTADGAGDLYVSFSVYYYSPSGYRSTIVKYSPVGGLHRVWVTPPPAEGVYNYGNTAVVFDAISGGLVEMTQDYNYPYHVGIAHFSSAGVFQGYTQMPNPAGVTYVTGRRMAATPAGGVYYAFYGSDGFGYLRAVDNSPAVLWTTKYSDSSGVSTDLFDVAVTPDANIVTVGRGYDSINARYNLLAASLDPAGNYRWEYELGSNGRYYEAESVTAGPAVGPGTTNSINIGGRFGNALGLVRIGEATPASLSASLTAVPHPASVGQWYDLRMTVANAGGADATETTATVFEIGAGQDTWESVTVPSTRIPGLGSATFTWTYSAAGAGTIAYTASLTASSGPQSFVVTAGTSELLQTPASLVASATALPGTLKQGKTISVVMTVTNTGQATAQVTPVAWAVVSPAGTAGALTGPGAMTVPGLSVRSFTWTYEALTTGQTDFSTTVNGVDVNSGFPVSAAADSGTVTITAGANLKSFVVPAGLPPRVDDTFSVTFTVSNVGDDDANGVTAIASPADPSRLGPGSAPAATVPAHGVTTYSVNLSALKAGSADFTVVGTGTDAGDGQPVTTRSAGTQRVQANFGTQSGAYPNPATGGSVTLGLGLRQDAAEVTVEIYNAAMARVFKGVWANVSRAEGGIVISGLQAWAPGGYLIIAKAKLVDGTTQKFDVQKLVVKR